MVSQDEASFPPKLIFPLIFVFETTASALPQLAILWFGQTKECFLYNALLQQLSYGSKFSAVKKTAVKLRRVRPPAYITPDKKRLAPFLYTARNCTRTQNKLIQQVWVAFYKHSLLQNRLKPARAHLLSRVASFVTDRQKKTSYQPSKQLFLW